MATTRQLKQEELLGKDIAIDSLGNFSTSTVGGYTDFAVVAGRANLKQALLARIESCSKQEGSRLAGSLPAHPEYGVGANALVSSPETESMQKLRAAIVSNLSIEPRIKKLITSDVSFTWEGSTRVLQVNVRYTIINEQIPQNLIYPIYVQ